MKIPDLKVGGDEKNAKENEVADLETAIRLTGFGKFHLFLIAAGGSSFLTSGLEYGLQAYTLPYAQCDLKISTAEMGLINVMFLAGSIFCSIVCGAIADTIGRKKVITFALILGGLATSVASWSPNYIMFALVRFISGFMSGAPGCLIFSYIGEFCSDAYRAKSICVIGFCWTFAWLVLPTVSWLIIPSPLWFETPFFKFSTWRVFVWLIGGMPCLVAGCIIAFFLTETPKFLYVSGQEAEAIEILKLMYHKNTGNSPDSYPVKRLVSKFSAGNEEGVTKLEPAESKVPSKSVKELILMMLSQMKQICKPPHLKNTALVSSIYFTNFFGYYGLGLWLPELFNRFQAYYAQHPNETVSVCELSQYPTSQPSEFEFDEMIFANLTTTCPERSVNLAVFTNTFIIGSACCLGNLVAVFLANKLGGRVMSIAAMGISGVASFIVYFSRSETQIVIVNCLFMAGVGTAMVTVGSCIVNLFPTSVRAAGVCVGILFGRLGAIISNLIFGLLLDISCEVPFFFLGGTIILGAGLCYLLPKDWKKAAE